MKVLIALDLPIEVKIHQAKGDRSFAELATLSGLEKANLHQIYGGRGTTLSTLRKLGEALELDVDSDIKKALREVGL